MADAVKKSIMIAGESFEANQLYNAGHVINEVEAKTLNQTRNENLRNNFAKFVKDFTEGAADALYKTKDALVAAFTAYDANYTFASPGVAKPKLDPVEREARDIAKEVLKNHLATTGRTFKSIPAGMSEDDWKAKIEENIVAIASKPEVLKDAKANVAKRQKTIADAGAELAI